MSNPNTNLVWRFMGVELDEATRELKVEGSLIDVDPKCFDLLLVLLQRAGEVITISEFQDAVWPGRIVAESAVTNLISRVRKALNDDQQEIIKTVPRVGYRLVAPVERIASSLRQPEIPALRAGDPVPGREQWRLISALKGGGYGDVWLAENPKTGEKRVFKFCADSDHLSALKREVTLSRLLQDALNRSDDYVRILEWNFETSPYFIESAYAGLNLREWFEHKGGVTAVPLADRIGVIAGIAEALGAAHSIGVLHKDLKPENILIEEGDGRRRIRIGDFGAGRLVDAGKLDEFGITQLGFTKSTVLSDSNTGTLLYLAPELISGGTPSVQSDIYSLGVMLYQLVADKLGKLMASGWETDIADELLRQDIADATHGSRERRLSSAQLLAERLRTLDQRRAELTHLRSHEIQTVLAQKALDRSRARKPWVMAAMLMLIAGFGTSTYFFIREHKQTVVAQEQAQIAQAFREFVTKDIMEAADPNNGGTASETLKDAVIKSVPKVHERFGKEPLIEASIDVTLGETISDFNERERALTITQRAASLYEKTLGPAAAETLIAQKDVAYNLVQLDQLAAANALLDKVLAAWQAKGDPYNPNYILARSTKLMAMSITRDLPFESVITYNKTLVSDASTSNIDGDYLCRLKFQLVMNLAGDNHVEEAEARGREYLPGCEQLLGRDSTRIFDLRQTLAEVDEYEGKYTRAESELNDLMQTAERREGPLSQRVLDIDYDLRRLYEDQGQWDKALVFAQREYEGKVKTLGPSDGGIVGAAGRFAWILAHIGNAQEALPLLQKTAVLARTALTPEEAQVRSMALLRLVYVLIELHRTPETAAVLKEMEEVKDGAAAYDPEPPAHWLVAKSMIARAQGNESQARSDAIQAIDILQKIDSPPSILSIKEFREMLNLPPEPVASPSH